MRTEERIPTRNYDVLEEQAIGKTVHVHNEGHGFDATDYQLVIGALDDDSVEGTAEIGRHIIPITVMDSGVSEALGECTSVYDAFCVLELEVGPFYGELLSGWLMESGHIEDREAAAQIVNQWMPPDVKVCDHIDHGWGVWQVNEEGAA